ncbi:hypothetical protein SteCoe_29371 [Stentor coeruleus]|uniref:Histone deacetylase interacting domain-containing protein n=1 Tax=Stentor coeruleus TaxID=5963 RepID=A0A1R2B638_9CILI|nr:hypothetical protein SteCoe_29371 [Stentor coeruleus]
MEKRVDCAKKYLTLVRNKFRDQTSKYEEFLTIMKGFKEQKLDTESVCKRVQELFKGHRVLLVEFNKLIPTNYRINVETRPHYNEAIDYMRRVKEETKDRPDVYSEFIKVLKKYQDKTMTIEEVNNSVRTIMVDYPILIESFKAFLPNYYETSGTEEEEDYEPIVAKPIKKRTDIANLSIEKMVVEAISEPINKNEVIFFKRLKKVMELNSQTGTDYYLELIKSFELYSESVITKAELFGLVEPLFKLSSHMNFLNLSSHSARRVPKEENREIVIFIQNQLNEMFEVLKFVCATRESSRRKHGLFFRPLSDFDTSKSKRHGHSYLEIQRPRILKEKPEPEINGQWVSVPYGSEDFNFRHFRKNIFEDALFKCEDERFELDMATENACYTLKLLEKSLEEANSLTLEQQKTYALEEKIFSKIRLRPIFSIYSDHAQKIIEMLRNSPIKSLPVVISRVKSKIETWKKTSRFDSERVWKEIFEKNFYKSLDHRSFYFKQNEKRMTNPKAFLTEAKARYINKEEYKNLLRKYFKNQLTQPNYEFLGGSRNTLFFNSFAGLSSGVVHRVPEDFKDDILDEFQQLDIQAKKLLYINAPDYSTLPHFRLLFSSPHILYDSIRLILYALEKSNLDKSKVDKWIQTIFKDFMGIKLPSDIIQHKVEEFFETIPEDLDEEPGKRQTDVDYTKRIIDRWINTENYTEMDIDDVSISESAQDPMTLKKDKNFSAYLPLLKDHQVLYTPCTVYYFIRFLYDIYERLLKVKIILSQNPKDHDYNRLEYGPYKFDVNVETEYLGFLKVVCGLLRNTYDASKFEDKCRSLLGNDSYVFFTFDKLVNYASKSLHALANDEATGKAASLFAKFSKTKLNEEMYLAELFGISPNTQVFRLHWNIKYSVLSVTYIESPYEKLAEQSVKNAQKYKKHYLNSCVQNSCIEELRHLQYRCELYLKHNDLVMNDYAKELFYYQNIMHGMVENSYKLQYIPGGEDFMINLRYYANNMILESDSESFICQDKNSLYQKVSEYSEKKFKVFRDSWIYQQ